MQRHSQSSTDFNGEDASKSGDIQELHDDFGLAGFSVTDSIPQTEAFSSLPFLSIRSLAEDLCLVVNHLHHNRSVSEVFDGS